jgi:tape measure domain-containing protein
MNGSPIGDMIVRIVGDNAQFDSSIDKSESKLNTFGDSASKIGRSLSLFVTTPLIGLGIAAVKSSAQMEMLETSFSTMLSSASKASQLMADLKDMAAKTPFETTDLANVTKSLLQYGVSVNDILPTLQILGDVSGGNAAKFAGISYQYAQMTAAGRLLGGDLRSMVNHGFNPLQEIARTTGETMASLQQKMARGAITTEMVAKAFKSATSEGGKFYNGMNAASQTMEGLISTLKDDIGALGRSLADQFIPAIKDAVKQLSAMAQKFTALDPKTKNLILGVLGFTAALGPALIVIGTGAKLLSALSLGFHGTALAANASSLSLGINKVALVAHNIATGLVAATTKLMAGAFGISTLAINGMTAAIAATGIGLLVVGLALAVSEIVKFAQRTKAAKEAQEEFNKSVANNQADYLVKKYGDIKDTRVRMVEEEKKLTKEQKAQIEQFYTLIRLDKLRYEQAEAMREASRLGNTAAAEAARKKMENIDAEIAGMKNQAAALTESQQLRIKASETIRKEITLIDENAKLAALSGEEYNADQEKRAVILREVSNLIQNNFTVEGEGIQFILKEYEFLLAHTENLGQGMEVAFGTGTNSLRQFNDEFKVTMTVGKQGIDWVRLFDGTIVDLSKGLKSTGSNGIAAIRLLDDKIKGTAVDSVDWEEWAKNEKLKKWEEYTSLAISQVKSMMSDISAITSGGLQNQIDEITSLADAKLRINDKDLQDELKKYNLQEKTAIEAAQIELDAALKTNDAIAIDDAKKALQKAQIEQAYADKKKAIEKDTAMKLYDLQLKQFKASQAFSIAQTTIETAEAAIRAYKALAGIPIVGPAMAIAAAGVAAGLGAAKIAIISGQTPPSAPSFAQGGVVMPRPNGVAARIAEAGQAEAVIPLDRLERMIESNNSSGLMELTVQMDSDVLLKKIFPATKNRKVLIHANAVVS